MKLERLSNPTVVGIFVLAAAILGMGTIIFVASMRLFRAQATVLVYFDESVNGLSIGSPVKFKGVPIGKVEDILIAHNQLPSTTGSYIPVFLQIDLTKISRKLDEQVTIDFTNPEKFLEVVRSGLRAKLQLQSFITGQLFVELDYFAQPGEPYRLLQATSEYAEIPSLPSEMEEFGTSASNLMTQVASIDVKGINDRLIGLLERLDRVLDDLDVKGLNRAVMDTATSMQDTMAARDLQETGPALRETLHSMQELARKLDAAVDPALEDYHLAVRDFRDTMVRVDMVLEDLASVTEPDGNVRHEIMDTLNALQQVSRSARELIQFIDRNPNAVLTGRAPQ